MIKHYAKITVKPNQPAVYIAKVLRANYFKHAIVPIALTFEIARGHQPIKVESKWQLDILTEEFTKSNIRYDINLSAIAMQEIRDELAEQERRRITNEKYMAAKEWAGSLPADQKKHLDVLLKNACTPVGSF